MNSYRNSDPHQPIMAGSPPSLRIPINDWGRAPWNRWTFQHVRELVPTIEVWRGAAPPRPLSTVEAGLEAVTFATAAGGQVMLPAWLEESYTDGFIVLHRGTVAFEAYFNGMTPRTLHLSQSMAKSVTGMVAGILIGRGLMDRNAPIVSYLPELATTGYKEATLGHVLDMTSGVRFSEDYDDPLSDIGKVDVASGWKPITPDFAWPYSMWEVILSLTDVIRPHGSLFQYRSIETDVLAFCMERVSGKRLAQLVSEELWQKIGADESANFTVDRAGYALADGGFNATLRDYARFGLLIGEGGADVIPLGWIEETRSGNHALFGPPYNTSLPHGAYRNQFWIDDPQRRAIMARGVFGQSIYISPEEELVIVKLSTWPEFLSVDRRVDEMSAYRAVAAHLTKG